MSKKREILARLKKEMNGAVAGAMEERGVHYGVNYGVSYPTIKKIAKEYFPDHELALELFSEDVRELRIAAIHIDDPAQVRRTQMERWGECFGTGEIADQAGMWLFHGSPDAAEVTREWLVGNDPLRQRAALYMAGRRAAEDSARDLPGIIEEGITQGRITSFDAAVYALSRLPAADTVSRLRESSLDIARRIAEFCGW